MALKIIYQSMFIFKELISPSTTKQSNWIFKAFKREQMLHKKQVAESFMSQYQKNPCN